MLSPQKKKRLNIEIYVIEFHTKSTRCGSTFSMTAHTQILIKTFGLREKKKCDDDNFNDEKMDGLMNIIKNTDKIRHQQVLINSE